MSDNIETGAPQGAANPLGQSAASAIPGVAGLDRVMDIPLAISVELGRTKMLIGELLQLGEGSVLELSKLAGEPLDVLVHGKLVARGEAVVVNDKFGIRLTDIVSPSERIQSLTN
tara:strand:+ start:127 stop:471 length:345 start_codon:yes stop_codon:yes gene_type:complete